MKKAILLIVVVLSAIASYSQCMLGYTEAYVRKEKQNLVITRDVTTKGIKYITYDVPIGDEKAKFSWTHYFNNKGIIFISVLMPNFEDDYVLIVGLFNRKFVIKSSTEWVMYED